MMQVNFNNLLLQLFVILCLSLHASAQENCTNGLDDDNDGLVDFNDNLDCYCSNITAGTFENSFLPNPSFEEYSCLPTDFTQLALGTDGIFCTDGWQAGTLGSSDYFINLPGAFWPNIPTPLSDGNAAAGFFVINNPDVIGFDGNIIDGIYMEYLKTCLTQPLQPGNSYNLQLNLIGIGMSSFGNALPNIWYGPIDITLFGSPNCTNTIDSTITCPGATQDWVELGHASYQADGTWQILNIQFTALQSIQAVMIGGPCVPPDDFTFTEANGETFEPYFVLDNAGLKAINTEECFDLVIPNVISPNQDGINDLFKIDNLPVKTELIILNRWGLEVFYSDSYQNNWDGRDKSGKLLSDGVYTYKLKTPANNLLHGFIHVVR